MNKEIKITSKINIGGNSPLLLIAGPCVIESRDLTLKWAEELKKIASEFPFSFIFKASYDKANRTSGDTPRGPGLETGLKILQEIKQSLELPVLTDVHESADCQLVSEVVDVLQIPAFLSRQTSLITAAANTGKAINIKKGQFLHPSDMLYAVEKVRSTGNQSVFVSERGTSFGYRELVVDMRGLQWMRQMDFPVVFDGTHSVQSPGGAQGKSGGNRNDVSGLVRAATAIRVDGIFLEVHPNPDSSPSDGPNMLTPELFRILLTQVKRIDETVRQLSIP